LIFEDYVKKLRNPRSEVIFKIEILDQNENSILDITDDMLDGSINVNLQNGARRSASLSMININNKYTPNKNGLIWLNTKFKISSGLIVNGEEYLFSNGIYCLSEPETSSYFSDTTASFSLDDKWSYADGTLRGTLKADYIIPVGTNIGEAVKAIIVNELVDVKSPLIVPTSIISPYTLTLNRGDNFGDMLIKLAEMISYECFYDKNGQFKFQPVFDDNKKVPSWDYSTEESTYLGSSRKFDYTKVKNSVYVYGDNINGSQVQGIAQDTYVFSQTNINKIGERVIVFEDDIIFNNTLASERAAYELKKTTIIQESTSLNSVPLFHLDCGDIVTIEDKNNDLQRERYIISGMNFSLSAGSEMKVDVWKTRPLE
jgi:hypothetical protein